MTVWIDCKEWNPEDHIDVLFVVYGNKGGRSMHVGFYSSDDKSWNINYDTQSEDGDGGNLDIITINNENYTVKYWSLLPIFPNSSNSQ